MNMAQYIIEFDSHKFVLFILNSFLPFSCYFIAKSLSLSFECMPIEILCVFNDRKMNTMVEFSNDAKNSNITRFYNACNRSSKYVTNSSK